MASCPNCCALLDIVPEGNSYICAYCGGRFALPPPAIRTALE